MTVQPLTDDDRGLIELARRTVDANTDGPDGVGRRHRSPAGRLPLDALTHPELTVRSG